MSKVVVTGVNGFVGKHLVRELTSYGHAVIGVGLEGVADSEVKDLLHNYISQDIAKTWPDLRSSVDAIINLAGLAATGPSFEQPQRYLDINSAIVTNMCEYYLKKKQKPRIIMVSSGAIYSPQQTMPLTEESRIDMNSPYVLSKVLNENQAGYYRSRDIDIVVARPFNHVGPGQLNGFVVPDLIEKLRHIDNLRTIQVGNLATKRDYTDVRDVARAYRLLASTPTLNNMTYNICSGKSYAGEEILDILKKLTNISELHLEVDQSKVRPNDPMDIFGSAEKLHQDTTWEPAIGLEKTLNDCLNIRALSS